MLKFEMLKNKNGSTLILITLAITAIIGLSALVVDVGNVQLEKQKFQNAVDAAALAAAQELPNAASAAQVAKDYIEANGFKAEDISVTFTDSNNTIVLSGTKKINYTFAKIFGLSSTTVHPKASAACASMGDAFNYVLFSGSKSTILGINGSDQYIGGSAHANKDFVANGSKLTVTGYCEAMGSVITNGSQASIGQRLPNSPFVDMPDFSEALKTQAQAAGQLYNGNKTYNGSHISVDSPIYVNGSVYVNGSNFTGKGCIIATGDIIFNGSNQNASSDAAVCFYSKSGSIYINGANAVFDGILYAPNGSIIMNGSGQTVNGRVIANTVYFNGSNLRIIGGTKELSSLPSHGVKLIK